MKVVVDICGLFYDMDIFKTNYNQYWDSYWRTHNFWPLKLFSNSLNSWLNRVNIYITIGASLTTCTIYLTLFMLQLEDFMIINTISRDIHISLVGFVFTVTTWIRTCLHGCHMSHRANHFNNIYTQTCGFYDHEYDYSRTNNMVALVYLNICIIANLSCSLWCLMEFYGFIIYMSIIILIILIYAFPNGFYYISYNILHFNYKCRAHPPVSQPGHPHPTELAQMLLVGPRVSGVNPKRALFGDFYNYWKPCASNIPISSLYVCMYSTYLVFPDHTNRLAGLVLLPRFDFLGYIILSLYLVIVYIYVNSKI